MATARAGSWTRPTSWTSNGGNGNKGAGAPGRGPITIRSIDGSALSLGTEDGWTRTITVTSATAITKGGQTVAVDALKVGDTIRFSQTRNADGTYAITAIVVPTPVAGGEVTAVDATTITVKGKGGATRVITVNGATVYKLGSAAGSKADVKVGVRVAAAGDGQRGNVHGDHRQDPAGRDRRGRHGQDRQFDHGQAR